MQRGGSEEDAQLKTLRAEAVAPMKADSSANIRIIGYQEVNPREGLPRFNGTTRPHRHLPTLYPQANSNGLFNSAQFSLNHLSFVLK
jgi:hypothetical protein